MVTGRHDPVGFRYADLNLPIFPSLLAKGPNRVAPLGVLTEMIIAKTTENFLNPFWIAFQNFFVCCYTKLFLECIFIILTKYINQVRNYIQTLDSPRLLLMVPLQKPPRDRFQR